MTWRSKFRIHSVIQRILQSHVRKRPPRLRPRNEVFKWLKASSGRVAMGLPSNANNVKSLDSEKAIWGKIRIKLKPKSKTCKNVFYLKIVLEIRMQHCKNIEINWLCICTPACLAISRKNITVKLLIISSYKETPPCFLSRDLLPTLNPTTRPLKLEMKNLKIVLFFFKGAAYKKNIYYMCHLGIKLGKIITKLKPSQVWTIPIQTCVKEKFNAIWLEVNSRQKKEATVETNNTLMMMPLCRVNVLYR